jgi:hypothetical protein
LRGWECSMVECWHCIRKALGSIPDIAHAHARTHAHARAHTRTHTHAHTHARAHTHKDDLVEINQ